MKYTILSEGKVTVGNIFTTRHGAAWWKFWVRTRKYIVTIIHDERTFEAEEIFPIWQFWRR